MIETRNDTLLTALSPFIVATPGNLRQLDAAPFGLPTAWIIDPIRVASETFLELLRRLDALTFGPEGMPMDKWIFYDCAELPGAIYGFALPAADLTAHERSVVEVPAGYEGPVPFSMYIAIPMYERGAWFGHNLASLNRTFPERNLRSLGSITKAVALKAFRAEQFYGATQWRSPALGIHCRFGPLDLHTAYTPAHSFPETLTYGFAVTDLAIRAACGDPAAVLPQLEPTFHLDADDVEGMRRLQREIEAGGRFQMVKAPSMVGQRIVHAIRRLD